MVYLCRACVLMNMVVNGSSALPFLRSLAVLMVFGDCRGVIGLIIPCDIIGGDSLGQMRPSLHYDACPRALLSSPLLYSVIWPWRAAEGSILPEL